MKPCGYLGDDCGNCHCSRDAIANYRRRISGPLLDRIDMSVNVPRPPASALRPNAKKSESSAIVRRRVEAARRVQLKRTGVWNAWLEGKEFEKHCAPAAPALALLERVAERYALSVRAQRRVLRVARTIADLSGSEYPSDVHVAEALSLRGLS